MVLIIEYHPYGVNVDALFWGWIAGHDNSITNRTKYIVEFATKPFIQFGDSDGVRLQPTFFDCMSVVLRKLFDRSKMQYITGEGYNCCINWIECATFTSQFKSGEGASIAIGIFNNIGVVCKRWKDVL